MHGSAPMCIWLFWVPHSSNGVHRCSTTRPELPLACDTTSVVTWDGENLSFKARWKLVIDPCCSHDDTHAFHTMVLLSVNWLTPTLSQSWISPPLYERVSRSRYGIQGRSIFLLETACSMVSRLSSNSVTAVGCSKKANKFDVILLLSQYMCWMVPGNRTRVFSFYRKCCCPLGPQYKYVSSRLLVNV